MKTFALTLALSLLTLAAIDTVPKGASRLDRAEAATAVTNFSVTASGFTAYVVDGVNNATLTLFQGETYVFNVDATGHPFYIKTARVTGTASQYTNGVTGNGTSLGPVTFVVPMDAPNQLFYQCGVHSSMGGTLNILGPLDAGGGNVPGAVWLGRATPNPVSQRTSIRFGLPRASRGELALFDARGRRVRTLWDGMLPAGDHSLLWDGRDASGRQVPSGPYFYRLRAGGTQLTGRLIVRR